MQCTCIYAVIKIYSYTLYFILYTLYSYSIFMSLCYYVSTPHTFIFSYTRSPYSGILKCLRLHIAVSPCLFYISVALFPIHNFYRPTKKRPEINRSRSAFYIYFAVLILKKHFSDTQGRNNLFHFHNAVCFNGNLHSVFNVI